jgi:hypothetical protein
LFQDGWVKLWRKTLESGILPHPTAWQVFGYCLLNAVWKEIHYSTRNGRVFLKPGQFVTGRKVMAKNLKTSEDKIRTALKMLSAMQIITIETTNHFSIITLQNWDKYQNQENENTNTIPNGAPTEPQRSPTEEEGKKGSIEEENLFYQFWSVCTNKTGKIDARKAWSKLTFQERLKAIKIWPSYAANCLKKKISLKDPQGWLNSHRFDDEIGGVDVVVQQAKDARIEHCKSLGHVRKNYRCEICDK